MQNGKQKNMVIYRNVLRVLSLWPPGKSSASQLIATLLWILKVWTSDTQTGIAT